MHTIASRRLTCRLCGDRNLSLVLPIKPSPIADAFVSGVNLDREQPLVPLDVYQCSGCGHAQNLDIINPELLFRDYLFTTSSSAGLVGHFRKYASDVSQAFALSAGDLVIEIGSNDGTLLRFFQENGLKVLGVDPARRIAKQATERGIPTISEYFQPTVATDIRQTYGAAKLVVANNVYAHADQLGEMTEGIASVLDDDGVFVFEVSYLTDIIDKFVFDTIYHEHLSYHSIKPFVQFFSAHGLHLFDVQRIPTKGGSMRGFVQKAGGAHDEQAVVQAMIRREEERGLHGPEIFAKYWEQIEARKKDLQEFLGAAHEQGLRIVGYGASTTVTTLMYHFELTDKLEFLIDDNQLKHGLYSPGCHLEVKPSSVLYESRPDIVVVLAWQYAEPIIAKHSKFLEDGGRFVIPLPTLVIRSH